MIKVGFIFSQPRSNHILPIINKISSTVLFDLYICNHINEQMSKFNIKEKKIYDYI